MQIVRKAIKKKKYSTNKSIEKQMSGKEQKKQ